MDRMPGIERRTALAVAITIALSLSASCRFEDPSDRAVEHADTSALAGVDSPGQTAPAVEVAAGPPPAWATSTTGIMSHADSVDRMLRRVRALTRWEQSTLRRDVNALQIARAKALGIAPGSAAIEELARSGKLVRLEDNTNYWTLFRLNFSVPYVTPSTEALLAEIGERFQARLDSADVPRYRLVITSALRTPDKQAALRRANSNASKIESAHEFGTTVDIAYRRFAPPLEPIPDYSVKVLSDSLLARTANLRSAELQAMLGRVLHEMKQEGKVMVMMERRQTVYHITVGRPYSNPRHVEAAY